MRTILTTIGLLAFLTGNAQDSLGVRALFHWHDSTLPASLFHNNTYNEVWGYAANGEEYAIIGSTMGAHIFRITEVDQGLAEQVAFVPGASQGIGIVHRDYKTLSHYLYAVCDEGFSTLQVIDLQYLPDSVVVVYDDDALLSRAHNIYIDTANARMYSCGGSSSFAVYSLQDPENPTLLAKPQFDTPWWSSQVGYVHDAFVRDNIAYTNDENAMHIIDFSVPLSPVLLGSISAYPGAGYNHSGWAHPDGVHYALCDETFGSPVKLMDVSDPTDIEVLDTFGSEVDSLSIVHNVIWTGDLLHAAYYHDGYWFWELQADNTMALRGFYDTSTENHLPNYRGAWGVHPLLPSGVVLVSDMQTGLWVLDISAALATNELPAPREAKLAIHPNPASHTVHIVPRTMGSGPMPVRILDIHGREVMRSTLGMTGGDLDIAHLDAGTYLVLVTSPQGTSVNPLVITNAP